MFFGLLLLHILPGCLCIINWKPILAPFVFHQGKLPKVSRQSWHFNCLRDNLQKLCELRIMSPRKRENCTYMYTDLPWFILKIGMHLCCQKTIICTIYADQNNVLECKCHSTGKVQREGPDYCKIQYITSPHSLGHSEMLFRVRYMMKAAHKFHKDQQLLLISISTTEITLQAHSVPKASSQPLVHNHEFVVDRKPSYSLPGDKEWLTIPPFIKNIKPAVTVVIFFPLNKNWL